MRDLGLRVAAFLGFVALFAGSVWAAYAFLAVEGAEVGTLDDAYVVAPGRSFTVPYTLLNTGSAAATLRLVVEDAAGLRFDAPEVEETVGAFEERAGWLTLGVPAGTPPGDHALEIAAVDADGARFGTTTVAVRVVAPEGGVATGDTASVWYVGRFEDGTVFDTNRGDVADGPWPKAPGFQRHPSWEPIAVQVGPVSNVVPGFAKAAEGLHADETRTVVVPPEEAYGPAWRNRSVPRDVEIERDRVVELRDLSIQRAQWERHVATTGQGDPSTFEPGDTFEIYDDLNTYRAKLVDLTPTTVVYRFDLHVGEKYTFYDFWRNASEVVSVNDTVALLRTTPTTATGERFTYFGPWEDMTYVKSMDEEEIVLRSDVPEGFTYTTPGEEGAPTTLRVAEVREDEIVIETPNPAPLAGKTLVFDVTLATPG